MFKLMIKTHNTTGLKYLCITSREDHDSYLGSGTYWNKHLKTYGTDISTKVIYQSHDYSLFVEQCNKYSEIYDVAKSKQWANVVPETGYNNHDGKPNVVLFWESADEETKERIIAKRNKAIKDNHFSKDPEKASYVYEIIGNKVSEWWSKMDQSKKEHILSSLQEGYREWRTKLTREEKHEIWDNSLGNWFRNVDPEVLSEKNRKARLNISPESKASRKEKIQGVYSTGKHDHLFERYSKERQGSNNPAARRVHIEGVEYGSIKEAVERLNLTRSVINNRLKSESDEWREWVRI